MNPSVYIALALLAVAVIVLVLVAVRAREPVDEPSVPDSRPSWPPLWHWNLDERYTDERLRRAAGRGRGAA